jgi:hypothetical protein
MSTIKAGSLFAANLSGFRGSADELDVVGDLNNEDFATAYSRLSQIGARQLEARRETSRSHR